MQTADKNDSLLSSVECFTYNYPCVYCGIVENTSAGKIPIKTLKDGSI